MPFASATVYLLSAFASSFFGFEPLAKLVEFGGRLALRFVAYSSIVSHREQVGCAFPGVVLISPHEVKVAVRLAFDHRQNRA